MCNSPWTSANLLNANSFGNDVLHTILRRLLHQVAVHQAGKITVQALGEQSTAMTQQNKASRRRNVKNPRQGHKQRFLYLISAYQLVGVGQPRHETPLLQPIDGGERAGEEDALHRSKRHKALA